MLEWRRVEARARRGDKGRAMRGEGGVGGAGAIGLCTCEGGTAEAMVATRK
jgi:hypothetical protein